MQEDYHTGEQPSTRPKLSRRRGWFRVNRADVALIIEHGGDNDKKVSPAALQALWLAILDEADEARGRSFKAAISFLARKAGLSKRTAANGLPILQKLGLIRQRTQWNKETGQFSNSEWELLEAQDAPSAKVALGRVQL